MWDIGTSSHLTRYEYLIFAAFFQLFFFAGLGFGLLIVNLIWRIIKEKLNLPEIFGKKSLVIMFFTISAYCGLSLLLVSLGVGTIPESVAVNVFRASQIILLLYVSVEIFRAGKMFIKKMKER